MSPAVPQCLTLTLPTCLPSKTAVAGPFVLFPLFLLTLQIRHHSGQELGWPTQSSSGWGRSGQGGGSASGPSLWSWGRVGGPESLQLANCFSVASGALVARVCLEELGTHWPPFLCETRLSPVLPLLSSVLSRVGAPAASFSSC